MELEARCDDVVAFWMHPESGDVLYTCSYLSPYHWHGGGSLELPPGTQLLELGYGERFLLQLVDEAGAAQLFVASPGGEMIELQPRPQDAAFELVAVHRWQSMIRAVVDGFLLFQHRGAGATLWHPGNEGVARRSDGDGDRRRLRTYGDGSELAGRSARLATASMWPEVDRDLRP